MGEVMVRREEILLLAYESSKNKFTLDKKLPLKLILERGIDNGCDLSKGKSMIQIRLSGIQKKYAGQITRFIRMSISTTLANVAEKLLTHNIIRIQSYPGAWDRDA
ncbi:hypothetical protein PRIPAC_89848 [Pristionchus pacificus]|uniref:Uncharacterized protein n=1 Tax=Pristionchus pacificus TaxID=54126 RepID=A0A2A6B767_PRIPA|nr:hypothetical protein PRIPAC_89848 [Pristionchus pacificus]|eukprot:PDM61711.1 hypothetical protein PRIPAC_51153 [Pristionchus pacificus]